MKYTNEKFAAAIIFAILSLAFILFGTGCTVTKWSNGTESFTRTSFGTKLSAQEISVTIATNGSRTLSVKGYANDQAQAIGVAVDAAVSAAIKSAKP